MSQALLIVDLQNDFLPGGALAVAEGDKIIPYINEIQEEFPLVVASKDWHPKEHCSFTKWPEHCVQKSPGSDFPPTLHTKKIAHIVYKGSDPKEDNYSALYPGSSLLAYLKERDINHLYIVGLATEYCVYETALDALALGFKVTILRNGCKGLAPEKEKRALLEIKKRGAEISPPL